VVCLKGDNLSLPRDQRKNATGVGSVTWLRYSTTKPAASRSSFAIDLKICGLNTIRDNILAKIAE